MAFSYRIKDLNLSFEDYLDIKKCAYEYIKSGNPMTVQSVQNYTNSKNLSTAKKDVFTYTALYPYDKDYCKLLLDNRDEKKNIVGGEVIHDGILAFKEFEIKKYMLNNLIELKILQPPMLEEIKIERSIIDIMSTEDYCALKQQAYEYASSGKSIEISDIQKYLTESLEMSLREREIFLYTVLYPYDKDFLEVYRNNPDSSSSFVNEQYIPDDIFLFKEFEIKNYLLDRLVELELVKPPELIEKMKEK